MYIPQQANMGRLRVGAAVLLLSIVLHAPSCLCVRDTKFYDILGISPDADDRTLKKAYKKQALKWHPDRHQGSSTDKKKAEDKFKEIAHAYETLSEPEKRKIYDQFGEEGLKQGGPGGGPGGPGGGFQFHGDPFEMFNAFFGGGGGGGGGQRFQFGGGGFPGGGGGGFQFQAGGGGGGFPGGGQRMGGGMGGGGRPRGGGGGGGQDLYADDGNIQSLDDSSFPSSSNGWVWLVEFYAPWCGHCQQLAPKWKKVAASLKGVVKVAAVNCDQHKGVCSQRGVRGYPTIMALSPGSTTWAEYQGDRSAASISSWATGLIGNAAVNIKKQADLDTFLAKCGAVGAVGKAGGGGSSGKKEGAAATWGLCVVLASEKSSMPSLWKALSQAFKGKVALGFIGSSAQAGLAEKLGVTGKESKVVSICNGDLRTAEAFTGKLKSEPLQRHINAYAAGKKCAAQVVLDSSTDLAKMKVAQLKALVTAKGVDCSGCFEKGDYVAALKGWLEQHGSGGGKEPRIDEL